MPLIPATDSALVPVPDWVSVPTCPNSLSLGRTYSARGNARELLRSTICLIFNGECPISARGLNVNTAAYEGQYRALVIGRSGNQHILAIGLPEQVVTHTHGHLDGGAGSGLGQCANRAKLFESRGRIGMYRQTCSLPEVSAILSKLATLNT